MILGGGPNRIGQGIEFDYCCCHASFALRELGIESIMVNSNPETVSTDYDTSDLLFFEPLTTEDVLNICDRVQPDGVIVQLGGQTPLNLSRALATAGVPIIGTSVDTIEDAEDREKFQRLLQRLGLRQPANGIARTMTEARAEAAKIGYPNLVRPSFVLGGRAMEICYDQSQLERFVAEAFVVAQGQPVLIDRFLEDAIEVDVDAICDGEQVLVAGIMEHIEEAGVHSGDSACAIPPYSLAGPILAEIREATRGAGPALASRRLDERAIRDQEGRRAAGVVRARSESAGEPHRAVRGQGDGHAGGQRGDESDGRRVAGRAGLSRRSDSRLSCRSRRACFRSSKFAGVDIVLGPEMRSTGEVMGVSERFSIAFAKSQLAAGILLPKEGRIFISVASPAAKEHMVGLAARLAAMGFQLMATEGTASVIEATGIPVEHVKKLQEGHPNLLDHLIDGRVQLIMNTPRGKGARTDEGRIRAASVAHGVPCITTIPAADACVKAMEALREEEMTVQAPARPLSAGRISGDGQRRGPPLSDSCAFSRVPLALPV